MQIYTHSEAGHRHINEDHHVSSYHPANSDVILCAIADGQGGQAGGGAASRIAAVKCVELCALTPVDRLFFPKNWPPIIASADDAVQEDREAGYSTLVGVSVKQNAVCGSSSGDSEAFLVTRHEAILLTEHQRRNPPIGSGGAYPVSFKSELKSPWKLLLATDGVYRYVGWEAITEILRYNGGRTAIEMLLKAQRDSHGGLLGDDFTAVLIEG